MKLYYAPGACSLSPHIVLREAGMTFDAVKADLKAHKLEDGTDYYGVNAKGYVPLLELDDGERLTEGPAIVQYIADQVPEKKLAPPAGTMARYRLQEWLNFITSELHKGIGAMFNPALPEDAKAIFRARATDRLKWADAQLEGKDYVLGSDFSVADAYLFVVLSWAPHTGIDLSSMKNLTAYQARVGARPAVQAALKAEGLDEVTRRRALAALWRGRGAVLVMAAAPLHAAPPAAAPAPGRYDAQLCVGTSAAPPSCGVADTQLRSNGEVRVQVSDIVYRLKLRSSQVDVTLMHGAMQIDEFSTGYAWVGGTLRFRDDEKNVRYELRFPQRGDPLR